MARRIAQKLTRAPKREELPTNRPVASLASLPNEYAAMSNPSPSMNQSNVVKMQEPGHQPPDHTGELCCSELVNGPHLSRCIMKPSTIATVLPTIPATTNAALCKSMTGASIFCVDGKEPRPNARRPEFFETIRSQHTTCLSLRPPKVSRPELCLIRRYWLLHFAVP